MSEPTSITPNTRSPGDGPRTRGGWAPAGTAAGRRANQDENPTTRGRKTRQRLLEAARRVFERDGYFDAKIDDIVTEAAVARGSFYTYFPDKLTIFQVVAAEVSEAVANAVSSRSDERASTPRRRLDEANRRYIDAYRHNAAVYGLIEQVATMDPDIHESRLAGRQRNVERVAQTIRRWQSRGIADPALDPSTTAALLVSMTSNFCYWWFVAGETHDDERAARELTATWVRVTGLRDRPRPSWVAAAR